MLDSSRYVSDGPLQLQHSALDLQDADAPWLSGAPCVQAGVIGFHAAGHGLSPEEEIASLSKVMGDFRTTLEAVKSKGRRRKADPDVRELDGGVDGEQVEE